MYAFCLSAFSCFLGILGHNISFASNATAMSVSGIPLRPLFKVVRCADALELSMHEPSRTFLRRPSRLWVSLDGGSIAGAPFSLPVLPNAPDFAFAYHISVDWQLLE